MKESLVYVERKNTNSTKWDGMERMFGSNDLLPLWIADMDFKSPQAVRDALQEWLDVGAFGYYKTPEGYRQSFINWEKERHGCDIESDWLRFAPGIVTAVFWLCKLLSKPGDGIAVLTPVYYPFFSAIEQTGRKLIRSELINTNGHYTIDFEDFESKVANGGASVFIMCSPHNPVGRVWLREEVQKLCDICKKHNVAIISDEIHQDLIVGENKHIPTMLCGGESVVTVASGSKTFNLAGLQNSFIIIPDAATREKYDAVAKEVHVNSGNAAGNIATQAAFESGHAWLESLVAQLRENFGILKQQLSHIKGVVLTPLEGTYLAWLDIGALVKPENMKELVQDKCGIAVDFGDWFGGEKYAGFIRINLATNSENIMKAAKALRAALE